MSPSEIVTEVTAEFLFKLIPEFLAFRIDFRNRSRVLWISSPHFHPDRHDRPREGSAKGAFSANASTEASGHSRNQVIFNPPIVLETQGDGLCSVKPLLKVPLGSL